MQNPNDKQHLIAELSHQINSPLAAIRNAVYLAARQTDDPALLRYLRIADEEITAIAAILRATRVVIEQMNEPETTAPVLSFRRAA
jgi:signal transduction histidine kinase